MQIDAIVSPGSPVLCVDTCSLLDFMRDPTRDTSSPYDRQAGLDLISAMESGALTCVVAEQVVLEFQSHDERVQEEAQTNLNRTREQMERILELTQVYGATGSLDLRFLDDHVDRARAVVERCIAQVKVLDPLAELPGRAFARVNARRAPAAQGKDSSKDCLIYETYIELARRLRDAGSESKIVLLSSNTRDYLTEGRVLKAEIAAELGPLSVTFASNMRHAKSALGL